MKLGGRLVKVEKDQVGIKEFFSVLALMIGTKATDLTTTKLFEAGLNAAWMVIIGSFIISLPSLIVLNFLLKKYQTKNLLEISQIGFGKPITFIIGFILFSITLLATALESRSYTDQLIIMNFPKTPIFILYLLLLIICLWGAKKGWESLGSVAWMVFPYISLALGILFFLLSKEMVLNRIFPLFGPGKWELVKASFNFTSIYADALIIAIMYPLVKDHKTYSRGFFGSLVYLTLIMIVLYLCYALVFDYRSVGKITYPYNEAIRLVSIGRVITNIETFFLTFWLLAVIVKFSVYLYIVSKLFGFIFTINEFEHTLIPITVLVLLIGMIPENQIDNTFVVRKQIMSYSKYFYLSLPLLLFAVIKIKEAMKG